jgi:hypothetical protein
LPWLPLHPSPWLPLRPSPSRQSRQSLSLPLSLPLHPPSLRPPSLR